MRAIGMERERFGDAIRPSSSAQAVLRGALALYGAGKVTAARELTRLLSPPSIFEKGLTEIVNKNFGTTRWTIPD
jgi:RNA-binding protein YlmH